MMETRDSTSDFIEHRFSPVHVWSGKGVQTLLFSPEGNMTQTCGLLWQGHRLWNLSALPVSHLCVSVHSVVESYSYAVWACL